MFNSWSTQGITQKEKYPLINDAINSAICPCQVSSDIPGDRFNAQLERAVFGESSVIRYSSLGAQKAIRGRQHLNSEESDSILLYLPITAKFTIQQDKVTTQVDPGSVALVPLCKPLIGVFTSSIEIAQTAVHIRVPSAPLRELQPQVDRLFNQRLSLSTGSGRVFQSLVMSLIDEAAYIEDSCKTNMSSLIIESIGAMCGAEIDRRQQVSSKVLPNHTAQPYILEFIKAHLGNPDLSLDMIANHFSSSRRFIHRAFENTGWTVWSYIREQRLLNCRRELQNRELDHLSISQICFSWGFKDVAHFSRVYKTRFGHAPTKERAR